MPEGVIIKALSGFYYVLWEDRLVECRARGRFRLQGVTPLVGDRVKIKLNQAGDKGIIEQVQERRNFFLRPAVANLDLLLIITSAVIPVTDPYLIDRVSAIAVHRGCGVHICINKSDLDPGNDLFEIYQTTGFAVTRTSALTGQGIESLRQAVWGKTCAFTGNSGVGKSSILNSLDSGLEILVGSVSKKLGRGRHTTRHVELFSLGEHTYIADTPGFASFEMDKSEPIQKEELQYVFPEFAPYLGQCRFRDCAHLKEPHCAVLSAVEAGTVNQSRHSSYARMYELAARFNQWEYD